MSRVPLDVNILLAPGGRFATFDRSVVLSAVPAATVDDLIVI